MNDNIIQFPQKNKLYDIIEEGIDAYISRIDLKVYKGFMSRVNRHLLDKQLHNIPPDIIQKLSKVSSGHNDAQFHPKNMLRYIIDLRGMRLSETAYYTATAFIFFRLQEHKSAYAMLKFSLVAEYIAKYNPGNIETLYREAREEENSSLRNLIEVAEKRAEVVIARNCILACKFFEWTAQ
jgi:hypothetical protein